MSCRNAETLPFLSLAAKERANDTSDGRGTLNVTGVVGATGAAPLQLLRGADAMPFVQPVPGIKPGYDGMLCLETDLDAYSNNWYDACWRVLFYNPPRGDKARRARVKAVRQLSLLGTNGHIERMTAWTHLVGAVAFLAFGFLRPALGLDTSSTAGMLAAASSIVLAGTFFVSTAFHTLGTVRWMASTMRNFDHGAIDLALAVALTCDTAIVTQDFSNVPWQTVADASACAGTGLLFFAYRRLVLYSDQTEMVVGDCKLGLFRFQHADFEHSSLRSSCYIILAFGFVPLVPAAFDTLPWLACVVLITCNMTSLVLLMAGMWVDNVLRWPDRLYEDAAKRATQRPLLLCHNRGCGCVMTSHAWWHVFSLISSIVLTAGREYALSESVAARR
jgi:predicted membrane channel-forming protein YqfA (hemolysin III family)